MNRKGSIFDLIVWIVVITIMLVFFAGFYYGFGIMKDQVTSIVIPNSPINISQAGEDTFGQVHTGLASLKWIALVITISMIISIMVSNFLVKAHPVFFIVYIMMTIVGVFLSVYIANAYESILVSSNPISTTLQSFTAMNFIMLHLPIWTTIVGIMGAIFLFIGIIVDRDQGGSIPV